MITTQTMEGAAALQRTETVPPARLGQDVVGKDQFLQLLVAQMKHQDPLNPMDGTDFTAQLAQFSSLEQLFVINENLEGLQAYQEDLAALQVTDYIGREVLNAGNGITVSDGTVSRASYRLTENAERGGFTVHDSEGGIVRIVDLGRKAAGLYDIVWDGTDMEGNVVPDGTYRLQSDFYDADGGYLPSETYQTSKVTGVLYTEDGPRLDLGGHSVPLQDVMKIY